MVPAPFVPLFDRYRTLGAELVAPTVQARDAAYAFGRDAFAALGQAGLFRLPVPQGCGGAGQGMGAFAAAICGLAAGSGDLGFGVSLVAHQVGISALVEHGSPDVHARVLSDLLDGNKLIGVVNAERGAGTDLLGLRSRATPTDDGFVLQAKKRRVTNVSEADWMLVSARRTDLEAKRAVNIYLVDKTGARTFTRPAHDLNALRTSPTGDLVAWRQPLPTWAEVGTPGSGLLQFKTMFSTERIWCAFLYLAAIERALARGLAFVQERRQFGRPIGTNQYVQERIVQMEVARDTLSALLWRTVEQYERGEDVQKSLSVAKVYGIEAALSAVEHLMRLLGGRGLLQKEGAEKMLRDLHGLAILGGTVELQKMIVYQEAVNAMTKPAPTDLDISLVDVDDIDPALERQLVALTARVFPGQEALEGKYYFDSKPSAVCVARRGDQVVALRPITRRDVDIGGQTVRIAGGIIPAVDPAHRRQGIARAMVERIIPYLQECGYDLSLAFLFNRAPDAFLLPFGFEKLAATFRYTDRTTGNDIGEGMPAYARALTDDTLLERLEAQGVIHLGLGTF